MFLRILFPVSFILLIIPSDIIGALLVGICYGRVANNLPPPPTIVKLLDSSGIKNIRLFDADPATLKFLSNTGISHMVGIPNENLPSLANGNGNTSLESLQTNVFSNIPATLVKYIAVGNEIFLKDPYCTNYTVPAMLNLYQALQMLNLGNGIKLSSLQAASVLSSSYPPSSGTFDPHLQSGLNPLLQFLYDSRSPFMVNVYPYISYVNNLKHVPLHYALFKRKTPIKDGELNYKSIFNASIDAFIHAMEKEGFPGIQVLVSETGCPTAGSEAASVENACV